MKRFLCLVLMAACLNAYAVDFAGYHLDDSVKVAGQDLVMNGLGVRIKFMIVKVYIAALYLPKKATDGDAVVNASVPRRMSMTMLRHVPVESLYNSLVEGMEANSTAAEMAAFAPKLKQVKNGFDTIRTLDGGDLVTIDFVPGKGMLINVKGKPFEVIEGDDFSRALLKIWFGSKPVQDDLKVKLLGG